jgi:hypothetical protein
VARFRSGPESRWQGLEADRKVGRKQSNLTRKTKGRLASTEHVFSSILMFSYFSFWFREGQKQLGQVVP